MDSVIWHERKALYPLKKKQLSVIFNSFQHWTITLYFHMNFISKLRVFLTNKRLQNRHRVPRCRMPVLQNFLLMGGCRKNGQRFKFTLTFHSCPLLSTDTVHFWVQCPVLCTLGSFRKKDIKHIILFLFSFLFVCAYLWIIYLRPPICFKQIHREM